MMKRLLLRLTLSLGAGFIGTVQAQFADTYPNKPIRLILSVPPGGSVDPTARLIAGQVSPRLRQNIVVENVPGGGGMIAPETVARATPDGYTLLLGTPTMVTGPLINTGLSWDPNRDLDPVTQIVSNPFVLVVPASLAVKSVKDLLAMARAKPGALNFGSPGEGSAPHLAVELLKSAAGIDLTHVPYKGGGPAQVDLVAGRIQLYASSIVGVSGNIKAGKLTPIAVATARRANALPDVPTVSESGVPGYEYDTWYGIFAPARTPAVVINKLNVEFAATLSDPEVMKQLAAQGSEPRASTPAALGALVKSETQRMGALIKRLGLKS